MTGQVLIVEDDAAVSEVVEHALAREGLDTHAVASGEEALSCLKDAEEPFDVVVLDITLPGMDGLSVCREIRAGAVGEANRVVSVIMLSARDGETSVVVGLEVGADDYVAKPFSPRQLVSRVRAQLRRRRMASGGEERRQTLEFPGLKIDLLGRKVTARGMTVSLTPKEFDVLAFLASHPGRVFDRRQIMDHLWNGDFRGQPRAADVHIQHIRRKLEDDPDDPRYVLTVRGVGYKFAEP